MIKQKFNKLKLVFAAAVLVFANMAFLSAVSSAATLTNTYIQLARMKTGTDSTMRVVFKTTTNAGATGLTIDMNGTDSSTWTGSSGTVSTTQAISGTSGCDVSATALPGSLSASGSGSVITVTGVTALSATTTYCFDLTTSSSVHTPSAGEYHPVITETGGATDSTTVAVRVVSDDQVVVSATVPPTFNFVIGSCPQSAPNRDSFTANLSASSTTSTTGCTVTVNTNAKNGWFAWAKDLNTGLNSASASHTIASVTAGSQSNLASSLGAEGYGLGITSLSQGGSCASTCGTTSAVAAYDSTGSGGANALVGGVDTSLRLIASSTGVANAATLTVKERANINATTQPATDYTDTLTIIGAGNF